MKRKYKIEGMHCNSCAYLIENKFKDKVSSIEASYSKGELEVDFDENKISEKELKELIEKEGYKLENESEIHPKNNGEKEKNDVLGLKDKIGFLFMVGSLVLLIYVLYGVIKDHNFSIPVAGDQAGLILLFAAGILTGFHCISMCGAFVISYSTKNAMNGHKGFTQHLFYGGGKLLSYSIIGGIFGFIGGIFAFSIGLRGLVAVFAGVFMIFYSLSMLGLSMFKRFQFNPKFLTKWTSRVSQNHKGPYKTPLVTGLLSGLFIACGPLQAMYLYAAGTGSFFNGFVSLGAFGLGTLPVMLGFGSLTTLISHNTTKKILKISAIIVLILGAVMLNRGLALLGSPYTFSSFGSLAGGSSDPGSSAVIKGDYQEINMVVDGRGFTPNSFVLKAGVPVKWNIDAKQLNGCNNEIIMRDYGVDVKLKPGINTVEFTPTKEGTIRWSCWMGMIRGSFIVTENGTASSEQIKTNTPVAGGSCGGSCGGCGGACGSSTCGGNI